MRQSISIAVMLSASVLLFPQFGRAQEKCQEFRAMSQWIAANGPFGGPVYAMLDGRVLIDPAPQWLEFASEICNGSACHGTGGKLLLNFGNGDTLTLEGQHGVYTPAYMPVPAIGIYHVTFKVVAGTGRFLGASGLIVQSGPWVAWIDEKGFNGRFSGELNGTICGAKSKQ